jgi:hypothetical protein
MSAEIRLIIKCKACNMKLSPNNNSLGIVQAYIDFFFTTVKASFSKKTINKKKILIPEAIEKHK